MSLPMSLILAPSNINCKLTGILNLQGNIIDIFFPASTSHYNKISLSGSGVSGQYLYNVGTSSTSSTSINLKGSGGGNLAGTPDIIYINLKGSLEVKPNDSQLESRILNFTTLLQITITGESALMTIVNPYGEYLNNVKVLFSPDNISLSNTPISVTYVNCTRYITIGNITLTFNFS